MRPRIKPNTRTEVKTFEERVEALHDLLWAARDAEYSLLLMSDEHVKVCQAAIMIMQTAYNVGSEEIADARLLKIANIIDKIGHAIGKKNVDDCYASIERQEAEHVEREEQLRAKRAKRLETIKAAQAKRAQQQRKARATREANCAAELGLGSVGDLVTISFAAE